MPLYSLTCKITAISIGNIIMKETIIILFLKLLNFDVKNLLSVLSKIIKANNNIKIKIGILNTKKFKKYVLGVLAVS